MRTTTTDRLDLNLLRVLWALTKTCSVTRTGELLDMSQPASSRAIARLRSALGDPLLVRTSKGYVLTPCAELLAPAVEKALKSAEELFKSTTFDPQRAERQFHIASTDYGALVAVKPIAAQFAARAPNSSIAMQLWGSDTLAALESGEVDLAFYSDDALPQDFHARKLFVDTYIVLVRNDHPLTRQPRLPKREWLSAVARFPQIAIRYPSGRTDGIDDILAKIGDRAHHLSITLPYFAAAPWMLKDSDFVLTLPKRVGELIAISSDLSVLPLPVGGPSFTYRMIWHERAHRDSGVAWLRAMITGHFDLKGKAQRVQGS